MIVLFIRRFFFISNKNHLFGEKFETHTIQWHITWPKRRYHWITLNPNETTETYYKENKIDSLSNLITRYKRVNYNSKLKKGQFLTSKRIWIWTDTHETKTIEIHRNFCEYIFHLFCSESIKKALPINFRRFLFLIQWQ